MLRGRKVTNPSVSAGGGSNRHDSDKDFNRAWSNIHKVKTELRKIEHRLGESEHRTVLNEIYETSITDYSPRTDLNVTYDATEAGRTAFVDRYGWTSNARNKPHHNSRKVVRIEDRYQEMDGVGARSRTDKNEGKGTTHGKPGKSGTETMANGGRDRKFKAGVSEQPRDTSPMCLENPDEMYGDLIGATGVTNDLGSLDRGPSDINQDTLTDSRAIRETDIRFLNNDLSSYNDVRWGRPVNSSNQNHLAHVSVTVPRARNSYQHEPYPVRATHSNETERERKWEVGSTDSAASDTSSQIGRKLKKTLKDLDFDALSKIKEKIRKQQQRSSSPKVGNLDRNGDEDEMGEADMNPMNGPHHYHHNEYEPVLSRASYDLPPPDGANSQRRVRKVAPAPTVPTYKGFSEAEVRYKYADFKPPKVMDWRKREKKKKAAIKLQEKKMEQATKESVPEETKPKKKMTRIVATSNKKPEKQSKKDIITTSSWRAGQELILRELGPAKTRRTSQTSEASVDIRPPATGASNHDNEKDKREEVAEPKTATTVELERAKALSEEARKVLSDLNMGSENEDDDKPGKENEDNIKRRRSAKRKASKTIEPEKQLNAKQRHYDQEEVRRFIQKQKADRLRQQREEEKRKQRAQEMRSQQLEELRSKQKQSAHGSKRPTKSAGARSKSKAHDETFTHAPMTYMELPRHHPFHEDLQSGSMATTESERERHAGIPPREEEMEMSDDSSTLTGESLEAVTPTITPRVEFEDAKSKPKSDAHERNSVQDGNLNSANVKNLGGLTFNVDGVLSKFSEALHSHGNDINSGYGGSGSSTGSQDRPHVYGSEDPGSGRSKADRIQAIMNTAATLQQKIQAETSKFTGDNHELYKKRALPQSNEEEDFVTRYERLTGAQQDFSVFSSNLPGQQRISRDSGPADENPVETAAIRIQAAYRGHTVRQSMNWKLPSGNTIKTSHRKELHEEEDTISETDTISVTVTEESEEDSLTHHKVGSGLKQRDFHAGSRSQPPAEEFVIPRPSHPSQTNRYSWESPSPDPYNVLSIFARQQKNQAGRPRSSASEVQVQQRMSVKEDFRADPTHSQHSIVYKSTKVTSNLRTQSPSGVPNSTSVKGQSAAGSIRSETSQPVSGSQRNVYKSRSDATHPKVSGYSAATGESHDSDEDTIEGDSYSQSFESDEEKHSGKVSKRVSEKSSIKSGYRPLGSKQTSLGPDVDLSIEEESQSMSIDRISPPGEESESRQFPPRLSPNSLERKFYLELNQLESMEESMRQLTGMERTRAVSMAQQETVSLAQMLKARQQAHEKDMKLLEGKAQQEAMEAMTELQNARLRGSAASEGAEEILSRLSSHRTNTRPMESSDNIRPRKAGKQSVSHAPESARTATQSYTRPTTYSDTSTRSQSTAESVRTASDSQRGADSDSSIRSLSKAEGKDDSLKEDSISEELEDYTLDETMTEDEMDRSFRSILPSESHRKRAKKQMDNVSVTSDEGSGSAPATPRYSMDDLGSFIGEDSFNKFTEEMVKQFMREEELRAQHQASLLQLREKALMEKTKAELSWLEQQKQRIRNKGADDTFPQIIKKQRGLKMRLQEQQAEIKRLQEQNKAASRERQLILQQHEEISRMRQQTEKTKNRIGGRLGRPSEVHTEDEVSAFDDHSDAGTRTHPKKDYKSDSEIYTEPKSVNKKGKAEGKTLEKMKKIHLDEKYLTVREHRLHDRRKNVEDLLKWKKRLDEEEEKIYRMEQTALKIWDGDKKEREVKAKGGEAAQKEKPKTASRKDKKESQTYSSVQDDSFVSEAITTAKDDSIKKSVTETPKTETVISEESSPEEVKRVSSEQGAKYKTSLGRSASESSIPEEVLSQSSVEESPVTPNRRVKSSVVESTALNDSYGDNTFVDESTMATSRDKVSRKSPRSPLDQLSKQKINIPLTGRDFKPRRHGNRGRSSESESEESISHTDVSTYTETQSDLSDFEGRVRALTEDLKRRKIQADKLKKERKKRRKDILKNKEEALKKQIEALDNQIDQLKSEIHNTTDREPAKVKPQILKPRVSPVKKSPEVTSPKVVNTDDSSTESTQSSPSVVEDKDSKPSSPVSKSTPVSSRIPASLDRISEGSESSRSRSLRNKEESSVTEDIETAADDSSVSGYLKIPKSPVSEKQPTYKEDDSYSMDFEKTASLAGPPSEKPPVSARSTEISHSKPAFNEQISEAISAVCSEHIEDSIRSESFVKPLDLKKDQEEPYSPRSSVTVSRPSSGKSERSYGSRSTDFESASESEPTSVAPSEQPEQQMKEESVIDSIIDIAQNTEDESEQYPVFYTKAQEEEDETPINSPRESSDFSQIDDPMADFNIGDYVSVTTSDRNRRKGQLLFKGKVHFAPGIWAGVELEKPDGKTDGMEDGKRYFSCKPGHGIFVPGNDLMPPPTPTPRSVGQGSANSITDESEDESEVAGEPDLGKLISEADLNVREFEKKKEDQDKLTDLITDQILEKVVSDECNLMADISDKKTPPPVAPKPRRTPEPAPENKENQGQTLMNGHLSPPESDSGQNSPLQKKIEMSNKVVDSLLDDALTKMLKISKKKRNENNNLKVTQNLLDLPISPTKELMEVLSREEEEEEDEDLSNVPPRPSSPMPGSTPQSSQRKMLDSDISALFDNDLEDDEMYSGLTPAKAPPPYPGTPDPKLEIQKLAEEVKIAVPHTSEQVRRIVASAVEIQFQHLTNEESINGQEPPDSYFTEEELKDEGLESSSRRVYKKLLFDLTGELMKEIYKDEQKEDPPPWRKPKQRRQKYFRGASPPREVDSLTPIVQEAVIDMLGLNGSRKLDRNKWNIRKKKDHVDNILVQELREEEPEWINYDDDEVAVKMQLTDNIFETLLTDTVQVMSKIYQKRRATVHN